MREFFGILASEVRDVVVNVGEGYRLIDVACLRQHHVEDFRSLKMHAFSLVGLYLEVLLDFGALHSTIIKFI